MARRSQPINADVPVPDGRPSPPPAPSDGDRRQIPTAIKVLGGLVLIAVVFIVAAIVGGANDRQLDSRCGPDRWAKPFAETTAEATTPETAETEPPEEIGYPGFATNNTTRVGGADPASNAAGAALAVFPSQAPEQRPDAVVLVDEADWQSAIAASVLMAEPVRAPLLVSTAEEVPDATEEAIQALDPAGSGAAHGTQAFVVGDAAAPDGLQTTRIHGSGVEAAATIAKVRDKVLGGPPAHVVIASAAKPAFAMPAAAWAARSGDPVLYANLESLPKPTAEALRRHPKVPVYVLGPSSAISSKVVRQIAAIDHRVRRVSGEDPVTNAIEFARYSDGGFGWNVNDPGHGFVVTRSDSPLDAVAAAPLSASGTWGPLLLTDSADTLPAALREYLLDVKPGYTTDPTRAFYNHVWVIGDQDAIDVTQQAEIDELAELAKIGGEEP